jgi:DNA primase
MNARELREYISNNDKLPDILDALGMHSINGYNQKYYTCGFPDGDNPVSTVVYKDEHLTVSAYTRDIKGDEGKPPDIFNLIMFIKECEFGTAINWCHTVLGLSNDRNYEHKTYIDKLSEFKKFRRNKSKQMKDDIIYYDLDILKEYSKDPHINLVKDDGLIDKKVLDKYMVMFDDRSDRIIFPHLKYDDTTKIAGIVGRTIHKAYKELKINKYMSMLKTKFDKTHNLYGLSLNIDNIKRERIVCVFEAEKSVMKLDMYHMPVGVAVGCHDVSDFQRRLLIRLGVEICICFDKDVDEEHVISVCESLKLSKVSYIKDVNNLLKDKDSPVDRGHKVWKELFDNRIRYK